MSITFVNYVTSVIEVYIAYHTSFVTFEMLSL